MGAADRRTLFAAFAVGALVAGGASTGIGDAVLNPAEHVSAGVSSPSLFSGHPHSGFPGHPHSSRGCDEVWGDGGCDTSYGDYGDETGHGLAGRSGDEVTAPAGRADPPLKAAQS